MRFVSREEAVCIPPGFTVLRRPVAELAEEGEDFESRIGFHADAVQRDVLWRGGSRLILNCTRQWGKSTVTAAKAVHTAYSRPGSLTLVISVREVGCTSHLVREFIR